MEKKTYECAGRKGTLYCCEQTDAPLIILNNYSDDGSSVIRAMEGIGTPDCNLLVIGNLRWDHDMTPWYCPPISENDTQYTGGADEYLDLLLTQILPKCCTILHGEPCFTGITGYSLAGLFALWAGYQTDFFEGIAAASPSIWFPGFTDYMRANTFRAGAVYLSLGDREERTKNPFMSQVGNAIRDGYAVLRNAGINCTLEWNKGNHFKNPDLRTALLGMNMMRNTMIVKYMTIIGA